MDFNEKSNYSFVQKLLIRLKLKNTTQLIQYVVLEMLDSEEDIGEVEDRNEFIDLFVEQIDLNRYQFFQIILFFTKRFLCDLFI